MSDLPKKKTKSSSLTTAKSKKKLVAKPSILTTRKKVLKPKKLQKKTKSISVKPTQSKDKIISNSVDENLSKSHESLASTSAGTCEKPSKSEDQKNLVASSDELSKSEDKRAANVLCAKQKKLDTEDKRNSRSSSKQSAKSENKILFKPLRKKTFKLKENVEALKTKKTPSKSVVSVFKTNVKAAIEKLNANKSTFRVASKSQRHNIPNKGDLTLYYDDLCPQSRSCLMLIRLLNYDVELEYINLAKGQQFTQSYRNINVIQTVPALKHNDLVLTDSHSILMYICETFDGNCLTKQLYPEDTEIRYDIMDKLFFNSRILCRRHGELFTEIIRKGFSAIDTAYHENKVLDSYSILNSFLANGPYVVGEALTIADIAIVSTVDALNLMFPIDSYSTKWTHLYKWFLTMHNIPINESNNAGIEKERNIIEYFGKFVFPALSSTLLLESADSSETFERITRLDKKESRSALAVNKKQSSTNNTESSDINAIQKLKAKQKCCISFDPQIMKIQEFEALDQSADG